MRRGWWVCERIDRVQPTYLVWYAGTVPSCNVEWTVVLFGGMEGAVGLGEDMPVLVEIVVDVCDRDHEVSLVRESMGADWTQFG